MAAPTQLVKNLEKLLDRCTSEELKGPDTEGCQELCNLINSRNELPKEAIKLLTRKISAGKPKVQFLALEALEALTVGCELPFHNQLGQKDFLRLLAAMLQREIAEPVKNKLLYLFQFWNSYFDAQRDLLPQFGENYQGLRKKGTAFPEPTASKYESIIKKPTRSYTTTSHSGGGGGGGGGGHESGAGGSEKLAKFKKELELVKENLNMANEMIDAADPKDDARKNEVLVDLMKAMKEVEEKLKRAITELSDENMMKYCLDLNDDLNQTLERFDILKKHKKPAPFFKEREFVEKEREEAKKDTDKFMNFGGGGNDGGFGGFGAGGTQSPPQQQGQTRAAAPKQEPVDLLGEDTSPSNPPPAQPQKRPAADLLGDLLNLSLDPGPKPTGANPPLMPIQPMNMQTQQQQQPQQQGNKFDPFGAGGFQQPGGQPQNMPPQFQQGGGMMGRPPMGNMGNMGGFGGMPPQMGGMGQMGQMNQMGQMGGMNQMGGMGMGGMPNMGMGGMPQMGGMGQMGQMGQMGGMNQMGGMGMGAMPQQMGAGMGNSGGIGQQVQAPARQGGGGIRMDAGPTISMNPVEEPKSAPKTPFDDIVDGIVTNELTSKPRPPQQQPVAQMGGMLHMGGMPQQQQAPQASAGFDDLI